MKVTSVENALIIHAIAAPIIFIILSLNYFSKFNYTTPLQTAVIFLGFIIFMDFFVVALLIEKNFAMFYSFIGTWFPFILIFLSTFITGLVLNRKRKYAVLKDSHIAKTDNNKGNN